MEVLEACLHHVAGYHIGVNGIMHHISTPVALEMPSVIQQDWLKFLTLACLVVALLLCVSRCLDPLLVAFEKAWLGKEIMSAS